MAERVGGDPTHPPKTEFSFLGYKLCAFWSNSVPRFPFLSRMRKTQSVMKPRMNELSITIKSVSIRRGLCVNSANIMRIVFKGF